MCRTYIINTSRTLTHSTSRATDLQSTWISRLYHICITPVSHLYHACITPVSRLLGFTRGQTSLWSESLYYSIICCSIVFKSVSVQGCGTGLQVMHVTIKWRRRGKTTNTCANTWKLYSNAVWSRKITLKDVIDVDKDGVWGLLTAPSS